MDYGHQTVPTKPLTERFMLILRKTDTGLGNRLRTPSTDDVRTLGSVLRFLFPLGIGYDSHNLTHFPPCCNVLRHPAR
jgi:hypothetical protein